MVAMEVPVRAAFELDRVFLFRKKMLVLTFAACNKPCRSHDVTGSEVDFAAVKLRL